MFLTPSSPLWIRWTSVYHIYLYLVLSYYLHLSTVFMSGLIFLLALMIILFISVLCLEVWNVLMTLYLSACLNHIFLPYTLFKKGIFFLNKQIFLAPKRTVTIWLKKTDSVYHMVLFHNSKFYFIQPCKQEKFTYFHKFAHIL